ncbi:SDR family NAD(P)-dependent oxidoreductase, partial [Lactobacillus sp. XV13L]|nr:SDR family NAD(P)-dependent oxidoreductase [Lactobacillus sp. XV13L]
MSLKDKVIVITGGSTGMGAATAKLAAQAGAKVIIGARNENDLKKAAEEAGGQKILYQVTDVTVAEQVESLIDLAIAKFGRLDVLYNNAGIMPQGNLIKAKRATWQQMLNINVMGVLNGIASALPIMKKQGYGLIMATDSVAGHVL